MKRPSPPNTTGSPGPRRPDLTAQAALEIADGLGRRERARLARLSAGARLRRWGQ